MCVGAANGAARLKEIAATVGMDWQDFASLANMVWVYEEYSRHRYLSVGEWEGPNLYAIANYSQNAASSLDGERDFYWHMMLVMSSQSSEVLRELILASPLRILAIAEALQDLMRSTAAENRTAQLKLAHELFKQVKPPTIATAKEHLLGAIEPELPIHSEAIIRLFLYLFELAELTVFQNLEELQLIGEHYFNRFAPKLLAFPKLQRLSLKNSHVQQGDLQVLRQLPQLESLNLSNTKVDLNALKHLVSLPLRQLYLAGTSVNDGAVSYLRQMSKLAQIELPVETFSEMALGQLRSYLPQTDMRRI